MQRVAGLDGMLVVSVPDGVIEPFAYDEEHTVLLMDWWHKSVYEQAVGLASDPLEFVGEPQSLLIDGRRPRNVQLLLACSRQALATPPARTALRLAGAMFTAVPGKTYRLSSQNQTFLFSGK